jgi:hypothetical protein
MRPVRGITGWLWMVWSVEPRRVAYGFTQAEAYRAWESDL